MGGRHADALLPLVLLPRGERRLPMLTFIDWCKLNGRLWTGSRTSEAFQLDIADYKAYEKEYFDKVDEAFGLGKIRKEMEEASNEAK